MNNNPGIINYTNDAGSTIYQYELKNKKGTSVGITNWGAIINYFKIIKKDRGVNDIVHGFYDLKDYLGEKYLSQYPWFGCVVGRYANRIRNASFELDGKIYQLTSNNNGHQLHGGSGGFDRRVWNLVETKDNWIELKYHSADGEEGYPGNLDVLVRYELSDEDELSYTLSSTCDQACPVNFTQHTYFNLNNNQGTIHDHDIRIISSKTIDQDKELVATGSISNVDGTTFDLREWTRIGDGLKEMDEYDKSFIRDEKGYGLAAELSSFKSGILLQVYTTEPVVHFYSGKWTPQVKGKDGITYGPFSGLCLETHVHPNAVNIPVFPNTVLRPGETYRQKTVWKVIA